jgi:ABC-2 type transport system permease protein
VAVDLAGIGAALALGNLFTVTMPFPIEKRAGSPIRTTAAGYTSYGVAGTFGNLFGVGLAVAPVIVAIVLTGHAPAAVRMPILVLCAAGYGLVLAWIGVRIAARAAEHKLPELCQVAIRSKL